MSTNGRNFMPNFAVAAAAAGGIRRYLLELNPNVSTIATAIAISFSFWLAKQLAHWKIGV